MEKKTFVLLCSCGIVFQMSLIVGLHVQFNLFLKLEKTLECGTESKGGSVTKEEIGMKGSGC